MKLLVDSREIEKTLCLLMNQYANYYIASAWASVGTEAYEVLAANQSKISKMVIGTHFYQTHPDFIKKFISHENTRFMPNTGGIYHPKIYLFFNSDSDWQCVVGSANFTKAAFTINSEVMIQLTSYDLDVSEFIINIQEEFDKYWERGEILNESDLLKYHNVWKSKQRTIEKLKGQYGSGKSRMPSFQSRIFSLSWEEYYQLARNDPFRSFNSRLRLLSEAKMLFQKHSHFFEMEKQNRRNIAGLNSSEQKNELNWAWFGSMKGAGRFHNNINTNSENISKALDCIPLIGVCNKNDYLSFVNLFNSAFKNGGSGVATASRLLAIKRPDYFICLNNKNKGNFCKEFGISKKISLENYWDEIIDRITDSVWWNEAAPQNQTELELWSGRSAMLDAIFYAENS